MIGLYSLSQLDRVTDALRALAGKCKHCIVYTRPDIVYTRPDIVETNELWRLSSIARRDFGITIIGGVSLHGAGGVSLGHIWDYVGGKNYATAGEVYGYGRWSRITSLCLSIVRQTRTRNVCIVSEPDPMQLGKLPTTPAYVPAIAWSHLGETNGLRSVQFWLDQPTITQDYALNIGTDYPAIVAAALSGRVHFMPLEPWSTGAEPIVGDWRNDVLTRWGELRQAVPFSIHQRLCVSLEPDSSFPWSPDTARAECSDDGAAVTFSSSGEPVLYLKHDEHLVELARAL